MLLYFFTPTWSSRGLEFCNALPFYMKRKTLKVSLYNVEGFVTDSQFSLCVIFLWDRIDLRRNRDVGGYAKWWLRAVEMEFRCGIAAARRHMFHSLDAMKRGSSWSSFGCFATGQQAPTHYCKIVALCPSCCFHSTKIHEMVVLLGLWTQVRGAALLKSSCSTRVLAQIGDGCPVFDTMNDSLFVTTAVAEHIGGTAASSFLLMTVVNI